jgi:hypothetical protein
MAAAGSVTVKDAPPASPTTRAAAGRTCAAAACARAALLVTERKSVKKLMSNQKIRTKFKHQQRNKNTVERPIENSQARPLRSGDRVPLLLLLLLLLRKLGAVVRTCARE